MRTRTFHTFTGLTAALGVTLFLSLLVLLPQRAEAVVAVADSVVRSNTYRIANINTSINTLLMRLVDKEYKLDPQQQAITTQQAMQHIAFTKAFIAAGNEGRAFFNQNQEVLIAELKVAIAENSIKELAEKSQMCGAFKNEVIAAMKQRFVLENARNLAQKATCSITEGGNNIESFMEGEWDWDVFYTMKISDPDNTDPLSALWYAEELLQEEIDEQLAIEEQYLNWGQGFLNQYETAQAGGAVMVCSDPKQRFSSEVNGIRTHECRVATPATIMRERMASILNIEGALKTNGDEYQETQAQVVDAIIRPTMSGGITGRARSPLPGVPQPPPPGGGGGGGGNCTPTPNNPFCAFPQVPNDANHQTTQQFLAQTANLLQQTASTTVAMREHLVRTMTKLQYLLQTVAMTDGMEVQVETAKTNYANLSCYTLSLPNSLANNRLIASEEVPTTIEAIKGLTDLFLRYRQALDAGQSTAQIESQYAQFAQSATAAPSASALQAVADDFNDNVELEFNPFRQEHDRQVAACQALNP